ncbi:MAG: helicase C-terminal domain-containing protein [Planctomycetota bacterium]
MPEHEHVDAVLGDGGLIAGTLGDRYEPRPEQRTMARAVANAMAARSHLCVEAGTGVGKSFAYLVPAIERCTQHGETVVIATNTIALQEQLVRKDIPMLQQTLGDSAGGLNPVLVKGRGNYVSVRRLALASKRQDRLFSDAAARRSLHVIEDWVYATADGTLSTLPPLDRASVWDHAQSDSGNCMGRKCPTYDRCFYQAARRDMERGNLLVCNHALFFSDLALRDRHDGAGFLPRYDHVVLDEAHMIEDVAADHFGLSLSEGRVMHLLATLYNERGHKGYLAQLGAAGNEAKLVERAVNCVLDAAETARDFFASLIDAAGSASTGSASTGDRGGRIREPGIADNTLTPVMNELTLALRRLKEACSASTDAPDISDADAPSTARAQDAFELNSYASRAADIADQAEALIDQTVPGCAYWIDISGADAAGRRSRRATIACSPIEVGPILKQALFGTENSVTMASATLATRTIADDEPAEHAEAAFAHFTSRVGCEGATTLQLGSPFDHARQMAVTIEADMPQPGYGGASTDYERAIVERTLEHTEDVGGGVFVLFTSFATLQRVAGMIEDPLDALGYPLLVQSRGPGSGSRTALLEAFRESGNAVLLGAASFWQGVDVQGDALRCVIITRLPFEPPGRPLTEARAERIKERGGDPFSQDSLPRAVIRFKQGIGRLIRSHTDTGRVVVLDPRITTKPYGKLFLRALPSDVVISKA